MTRSTKLNLAFPLIVIGVLVAVLCFQIASWLNQELTREPGLVFTGRVEEVVVGNDRCSIEWSAPQGTDIGEKCLAPAGRCGAVVHCNLAASLEPGDPIELEWKDEQVRATASIPSRGSLELRRGFAIAGVVLGVLMVLGSGLLFRSIFKGRAKPDSDTATDIQPDDPASQEDPRTQTTTSSCKAGGVAADNKST